MAGVVRDYKSILKTVDVVIASGASLSAAIDVGAGNVIVGVVMPAEWTAANLTLQASADGATYNNAYDRSGNELTITAAASRAIAAGEYLLGLPHLLKVRSGTNGTPVNQAADRTITLLTRPV